ncbi:hypothetical protein [Alcanivorax sp. 1008]|uniref:hypothetical protein n=1 Tax=Alcanivorax sp. 1008 TaxID=2816853 RepID=UPI001DDB49CA|nr:hypothetical protein [Alcanivorax sp. 1008]MCC1496973.1 hypothetical protein [Alcanivorax sp. 1008]
MFEALYLHGHQSNMRKEDKKVIQAMAILVAISAFTFHFFIFQTKPFYSLVAVLCLVILSALNYSFHRKRIIFDGIISSSVLASTKLPYIQKAQIYAHYGKLDQSVFELKNALDKDPDNKDLGSLIAQLQSFTREV